MTITDEQRKRLTEYLGECYHDIEDKGPYQSKCSKCGLTFGAIHTSDWNPQGFNRTFDNDADMMVLFRKMVDEGELDNFLFWCSVTHFNFPPKIEKLFYKPERFCNLVAEWLEVKK